MAKYKDIVLVFLIAFLYHTMNQMFVPTLPLYITGLGGNEAVVGALVGFISLGAIFAKVVFGKMSTRYSNLLVLRIGLVTATFVLFLYQPFWGFGFLALVRLIQSIGLAGFLTGIQGMISEQSHAHNRGMFFGIFSAMAGLGMTAGPVLGSFLAERFDYSTLFWTASLIVGFAMVLSFVIKEKPAALAPGMGRKYQPHSPWKNPDLLVVSGCMLLGATYMGATSSMLALHAQAAGIANPGLFFGIFALVFTAGGAISGPLSDRFGRSALIIPGFGLLIAGLLCLSMLNGFVMLSVSAVLCGIGFALVNTVLMTMVPGYSKNPIDVSNDLAFFSNAFDLGVVLGSIGLSWLAAYSFGLFWLAVALVNAAGLVLFLRCNPEKRQKTKAQV